LLSLARELFLHQTLDLTPQHLLVCWFACGLRARVMVLSASTHRLRKQVHGLCGKFFSDFESQSPTPNALARDTLFVGVLPRGALLWMRRHDPHHFEMLLSLESIDEGLERFIFVLVHLEEPVPSLLEVVASHCKVSWMPLDFGVDALDCAHIILQKLEDPERPLPSKSARISAQSRTTGMSQICSAVSRSIFSFSPFIMQVICDVMKNCRSCAE
jgi:hypothetical protein